MAKGNLGRRRDKEKVSRISTYETMDSSKSDRLSELPDSLIMEILSLLPMTDVVATMLLSKRWLHLWTTVPCLDFNYKFKKYKQFVSGALALWKGSKIHKFSLNLDVDSGPIFADDATVDSWLLLAIEKQVEELHVCDLSQEIEYCPPQRLYSCSSVTKMSLAFCNLRIDEAVQWNRLKRLEIEVLNVLREDDMTRILAGAPLLEELILEDFHSNENLSIRSISLKILRLCIYEDAVYAQVVRIWAPNLLDLAISGCFYGTCLLDVPSLSNADICFQESDDTDSYDDVITSLPPDEMFHHVFQSIRHVEKLSLSVFNIKPLLRMKHGFEFPNAKSLSFSAGLTDEMFGVLDMFPNMTTLCVRQDWDAFVISEEEQYEADQVIGSRLPKADLASPFVPFLKRVEITWFMYDASIIPAVEILLENAKVLDKMVFRADWQSLYCERPEQLLSKSASSPTAEVTIIHVE